MKVKSIKGVELDVSSFINKFGKKKALGNAGLNARGDRVDSMGNIIKRREDIALEYHKNNPKSVKQVSIKDIEADILTPKEAAKLLSKQKETTKNETTEGKEKSTKSKRKIVDSD